MLALFLIGVASADVDTEDRWVGNDNLAIGVNQDGSFVNEAIELGILWDPDGPEGAMPLSGDMLRVGYHWDLWIWGWESTSGESGARIQGGPHTDEWKELEWTRRIDNEAVSALQGQVTDGPLEITLRITALKRTDVVLYDMAITSSTDLSTLAIGRTFDPDQDSWFSDTYDTINASEDNWAYGASAYDDRAIGIAGIADSDGMVTGGVCHWCDTVDDMAESAGVSNERDRHPNVLVQMEDIEASKPTKARFVYGFAVGGEAAKERAIEHLELTDIDDDGLSEEEGDCNDWMPDVYPGAVELPDGIDNDCDDEIDEDSLATDDDGDGFTEEEGDCDDTDPEVYPGAASIDGVTNADCDGLSDTPDGGADGEDVDNEDPSDTGVDEDPSDTGIDGANDQDSGLSDEGDGGTPGGAGSGSDISGTTNGIEDEGDLVIAGSKQACNCATSQGKMPWMWLCALLVWKRRRRERP